MFVLAVVVFPAFAGGKHKPVAHIGDLAGPAFVEFGQPGAAAQAFNDLFNLQKFGL